MNIARTGLNHTVAMHATSSLQQTVRLQESGTAMTMSEAIVALPVDDDEGARGERKKALSTPGINLEP